MMTVVSPFLAMRSSPRRTSCSPSYDLRILRKTTMSVESSGGEGGAGEPAMNLVGSGST